MTYRKRVFTGIILQELKSKTRTIPYRNGQIHGDVIEVYRSIGGLAKRQPYVNGKKEGLHEGFYPTGARKFQSHYRNGAYDGETIQWYENGQPYSFTLYKRGKVEAHKLWRRNGRIYSNYVYKNGRKLGLDGGKLCFTAKDKTEKM